MMKRVIEMSATGKGFTRTDLPENQVQFTLICEKGMLDENKLNSFLLFLESKTEPEVLMCLHNMMFQMADNEFIDFTKEQLAAMESVLKLLTMLWACERRENVRTNGAEEPMRI